MYSLLSINCKILVVSSIVAKLVVVIVVVFFFVFLFFCENHIDSEITCGVYCLSKYLSTLLYIFFLEFY